MRSLPALLVALAFSPVLIVLLEKDEFGWHSTAPSQPYVPGPPPPPPPPPEPKVDDKFHLDAFVLAVSDVLQLARQAAAFERERFGGTRPALSAYGTNGNRAVERFMLLPAWRNGTEQLVVLVPGRAVADLTAEEWSVRIELRLPPGARARGRSLPAAADVRVLMYRAEPDASRPPLAPAAAALPPLLRLLPPGYSLDPPAPPPFPAEPAPQPASAAP